MIRCLCWQDQVILDGWGHAHIYAKKVYVFIKICCILTHKVYYICDTSQGFCKITLVFMGLVKLNKKNKKSECDLNWGFVVVFSWRKTVEDKWEGVAYVVTYSRVLQI